MKVETSKSGLFILYCLTFQPVVYPCLVGLVVKKATYGPSEQDDDTKGLNVDVTIAVQALVHNSQVYVPGHRSKVSPFFGCGFHHASLSLLWKLSDYQHQSGIQGFLDPTPSLEKSLRVRYLFRGNEHYAEIPDYLPVILPLKGKSPHVYTDRNSSDLLYAILRRYLALSEHSVSSCE